MKKIGRGKDNFTVTKYRIRYFLSIFLKILKILTHAIIIFLLVSIFLLKNNFILNKLDSIKNFGKEHIKKTKIFLCKEIYIDGVDKSRYKKIEEGVLNYCNTENSSLEILKNNILKDAWIKEIYIKKELPSTIKVVIKEFNPFAIWINNEGKHHLIDEYGNIINISENEIKKFNNLFIIVGNNINSHIYSLFNLLSIYPEISNNIQRIIRVGDRRWDLVLKNNTRVKLPEENVNLFKTWQKLDKILKIYKVNNKLKFIDLRIENKIYLKYNKDVLE